jgi:predicted ribonuclease YlaK
MTTNYDGITNASYMHDEAVRSWAESLTREHNPDVTDEAEIKLLTDRVFHQYPVVLMLKECEKRLAAANKALAAAQYRNTSLDNKTDKTTKTLTSDPADEKKAHAETKEDLERTEKQLRSSQSQIEGLMKAQGL